MAVRIRLARMGAKKQPFYRVMLADVRAKNVGRFLEQLGTYDPLQDPPKAILKEDRILHWLKKGASPSQTVHTILKKQGIYEKLELEKMNFKRDEL